MKIAIGCDHAGYPLKVAVKDKLLKEGFEVVDFGTDSVESVDYPSYGKLLEKQSLMERLKRESLSVALA